MLEKAAMLGAALFVLYPVDKAPLASDNLRSTPGFVMPCTRAHIVLQAGDSRMRSVPYRVLPSAKYTGTAERGTSLALRLHPVAFGSLPSQGSAVVEPLLGETWVVVAFTAVGLAEGLLEVHPALSSKTTRAVAALPRMRIEQLLRVGSDQAGCLTDPILPQAQGKTNISEVTATAIITGRQPPKAETPCHT